MSHIKRIILWNASCAFVESFKTSINSKPGHFFLIKEKMQYKEEVWTPSQKQELQNMLYLQDSVSLAFFLIRWVMFKL